ncbi:hypothetical protein [uncultured Fusobacterium sp.]|uniref:hypothetical protein n=1 Tax=uncultured Fusobacterium sp. TaxID=159267 RepID=UPI002591BB11|nr:hypothetical protein [uncultured Fusobacterium sp.]
MTYPEVLYKIVFGTILIILIVFFVALFLIILKNHIETKNEIKEEKKEFDKKLAFIKCGMSSEEIKEFENLTMNDRKEFVNKIYNQKYKESLKKYEKTDFKE